MREIKFRAWEKNLKEIIPVYNIDFEKKMINTDSAWRLFDETELMQSTGLKDKNDKEIFEGDIVSFKDWKPKAVVFSEKYYAGFTLGRTDLFLSSFDAIHMKVIGNIYENPELLES